MLCNAWCRCEESMRAEAIRRRLVESSDDSDSDLDSAPEVDNAGEPVQGAKSDDCYVVPATGARVTMSNAKSLLFHYCSKLPSDK